MEAVRTHRWTRQEIERMAEACVEVYREPFGETYRSKTTGEGETPLASAAVPEAALTAQDLLP